MEKKKMSDDQLSNLISRFISEEIDKVNSFLIPVSLSGRHAHLNIDDFHQLFGSDYEMHPIEDLSQPGQYACDETVDLIGPKRAIYGVRVLGPSRKESQVEISRSDGYVLGINPPVRQSGDIEDTPGIHIIGSRGAIELKRGVIVAARHIHMSPDQAEKFGVSDKQMIAVSFPGKRAGILDEVMVRVNPKYSLDMHLDTDEGNALGLKNGDLGKILTSYNRRIYPSIR